jgi:O-antigen/teichoic acid export membrane protein
VRDLARRRDKAPEYLLSAFVVKVFSSCLCYLGIALYLRMRGYSGIQLAVGYLLCSTVIAESFNASCRAVLAGLERQDLSAVVSVVTNVLRVGAVVILVYSGYNIVAVAWVTVGATALTLGLQVAAIRGIARAFWHPSLAMSRHLVTVGATFLASDIFLKLFDRADYIMLDIYKDVGTVGIYGAAYRIIEITATIGYTCSLAIFPIMSRRVHGSKEDYARAISRSTKYLTIFGIPFCVGIFLLSRPLMIGLYHSPLFPASASGTCLSILIWSRIAAFAIVPGQQAVAARNAQLWLLPPVIARAAINIGLNLYLIPRYGYIGASVAMVITENIFYVLNYIIAFRGPERFNPIALLARPSIAAGIMAVVVLWLRPYGMAAATAGALVTYPLALLALGAIDSEDKRILRALVSRPQKGGGDLE